MAAHTNLDTTATAAGNRSITWFEAFKQHGFYLKPAIIATLFS